MVLALLAGTNVLAKRRYKQSCSKVLAAQNKHLSAALFVVFFVYSSVSNTIFQTFVCDTLDDGVSYLQADYSLTCSTRRHRVYTAYASLMVAVYPLGIPVVFSWWLGRNRKYLKMSNRESIAHLQPFAGIWGPYKPSRYYFEVVECCRRIVLTASAVFLVPNSVGQISVVLSLAVVFMFASESMCPFERNADMSLYRWGNGIILASMYVALLMNVDTAQEDEMMLSVFGVVLITANVVMVLVVVVQSVLLAQEWRGFGTTVEAESSPVLPPTVVSLPSVTSGRPVKMQRTECKKSVNVISPRLSAVVQPSPEISPAALAPLTKPGCWLNSPCK